MWIRIPHAGIPADRYGFTLEERLKYSKVAIQYLVNDADISYLGELRLSTRSICAGIFVPVYGRLQPDVQPARAGSYGGCEAGGADCLEVWWAALGVLLAVAIWPGEQAGGISIDALCNAAVG